MVSMCFGLTQDAVMDEIENDDAERGEQLE